MNALPAPAAENTSRLVWSIALPAALTNVATALFALADMWVIGRLGDAPAQGAVEIGAKFMTSLFVTFNFLKTSTIALTAQSAGRGDSGEQAQTLARALGAALLIGVLLLLARPFAIGAGLALLEAKDAVADNARTYIGISYWSGALWLVDCVLTGWLIGQRRVRTVLLVEIAANASHIGLDLLFVLQFGWGIAGVAIATVCSEALRFTILAAIIVRHPAASHVLSALRERSTWHFDALKALFALNRDLFLRTLLLTSAMLIFARTGAQQGPVMLAANGILFQMFMLSTMVLDGFENSAQVLCGEAKGSTDRRRFLSVVRLALLWGSATGIAMCIAYLAVGDAIAASFSTDPQVRSAAMAYVGWVALLPILGVVSFVLDGVFVGAGWTRAMLVSMAIALGVYIALLFAGGPLGNTGLWLAFSVFFVIRAGGQVVLMPRLIRRDFGRAAGSP